MKITLLYLCGSDENERLFNTNIMYSTSFNDYGMYNVKYAVINPDFKVCFPDKIDFTSISNSEKYDMCKAMDMIKCSGIDIVILNAYGVSSVTKLRATLELLDIPIIGASSETQYIANNKLLCQSILEGNRIIVPPRYEIHKNNLKESLELAENIGYPLVIKCATVDDSKGVFLVKEMSEMKNSIAKAFNLCQTVFIEKFIKGKELRCAIIETEDGNKMILPIMEYLIDETEIRTFDNKLKVLENGETVKVQNVSKFFDEKRYPNITRQVQEVTLKVFSVLKTHEFIIVDFRIDENDQPYILEVNLFCSFGEKSLLNIMAREIDMTDKELLEMTVNRALKRSKRTLNIMK